MKNLLFGLLLFSTIASADPRHGHRHHRTDPEVLHVGQSVIFTQTNGAHFHARILEIFQDGKVRVTFPSGEYADSDVNLSTLSLSLNTVDGFQVGEKVVFTQTNGNHYNARIMELFEDGKARINFPSGEYADSDVLLETISKPLNYSGEFEVGNSVIFTQTDGRHFHANIVQIFNDGKIRVTFPAGEYSDSDVKASTLSKTLSSLGELFPGEDVVFTQTNGNHYNARIIEIYSDGKARVTFPAGEYADSDVNVSTLSLSRTVIHR